MICYIETFFTTTTLLQFSVIQVLTSVQEILSQINRHSGNYLGNNKMAAQRSNSPRLPNFPGVCFLSDSGQETISSCRQHHLDAARPHTLKKVPVSPVRWLPGHTTLVIQLICISFVKQSEEYHGLR